MRKTKTLKPAAPQHAPARAEFCHGTGQPDMTALVPVSPRQVIDDAVQDDLTNLAALAATVAGLIRSRVAPSWRFKVLTMAETLLRD